MHAHAGHVHGNEPSRVLRISLGLTLAYIVLLIVAGVKAHSLALLSEAGHNASDFLALLLSLGAVYLQQRPPSPTKTYGYSRAGVLAAFLNAMGLVVISFVIFYEAFHRLFFPAAIHARVMIWVAALGVLLNGAIAWLLYRSSHDLNIRSAFLNEFKDKLRNDFRIYHTTIQFEHVVCDVAHGCVVPTSGHEQSGEPAP